MPPLVPFLILLWEPQATSQKVPRHPPLCWHLPSEVLLSPAGARPHFLQVLQHTLLTAWQLPGEFLAHPPQPDICFFGGGRGEGRITACHSWFIVLCLTSSNYQCSKGIFLACQSWFVVFNPPDCWSALIKHSSTNIYAGTHKLQQNLKLTEDYPLQCLCIPWVFSISSVRFFRIFFYSLLVINSLKIIHNSFILLCDFHLLTRP